MKEIDIFTLALGLESPLLINSVEFKAVSGKQELHIEVGYEKGTKFEYEGLTYSIYDHQERTWRHLDFFQHTCYLHCRVPRIKTIEGKVVLVDVPWSNPLSRFTLSASCSLRPKIKQRCKARDPWFFTCTETNP